MVAVPTATEVRVTIPGPPCAQGRPRITTIGGHARAYDPAKSRSWKGMAAVVFMAAMREQGVEPFAGPVVLTVRAFWPCRGSRKRVPIPAMPKSTRPDLSNVVKAVEDSMGAVWADDAQVAELHASKWYAAQGESPRVEVVVTPLEES